MTTKDDGGAAFPRAGFEGPEYICEEVDGMTLRDYFAGQALACVYRRFECGSDPMTEDLAFQAYAIADAMIAERNGETK